MVICDKKNFMLAAYFFGRELKPLAMLSVEC